MAVEKSLLWNSASLASVPGVRDTIHGEDRVHSVARGSTEVLPLATVRGDDFTEAVGTQSLDMLDEALEHFFVLEKMPSTGPLDDGGTSDALFTKKTMSWGVEVFDWKADNSQW